MAKKRGKRPEAAPRNFVHLHGLAFNKGEFHADKRKDAKMGKRKHKAAWEKNPGGYFFCPLFNGITAPQHQLSSPTSLLLFCIRAPHRLHFC